MTQTLLTEIPWDRIREAPAITSTAELQALHIRPDGTLSWERPQSVEEQALRRIQHETGINALAAQNHADAALVARSRAEAAATEATRVYGVATNAIQAANTATRALGQLQAATAQILANISRNRLETETGIWRNNYDREQ